MNENSQAEPQKPLQKQNPAEIAEKAKEIQDASAKNRSDLSDEIGLAPDEEERHTIVKTALSVVGSKEFRGNEVEGGTLACAKVVTAILKDSGTIDDEFLSVTGTRAKLIEMGWNINTGNPLPGDVIIWKKTPSKIKDGEVVPGHSHIGIVVNVEAGVVQAVSNSSSQKMPRLHEANTGYWAERGIEMYLSPPRGITRS